LHNVAGSCHIGIVVGPPPSGTSGGLTIRLAVFFTAAPTGRTVALCECAWRLGAARLHAPTDISSCVTDWLLTGTVRGLPC